VKIDRKGKAAILTRKQYLQVVEILKNPRHRLIFLIGSYTAERWGAIRQLKITDIFEKTAEGWTIKSHITFDKRTRKGKRDNRQVAIHPELHKYLEAYELPNSDYLFPSPMNPNKPITHDACDRFLRKAFARCGIVGASTHSTRRSAITNFFKQSGHNVAETRHFSGHRNSRTLIEHYIEVNQNNVDRVTKNLVPCV
jgi:integrase/recombinase XerD